MYNNLSGFQEQNIVLNQLRFYIILRKMFPTQKKIELFAREKHDGWTVWGLDVLSLTD